MEEKAADHGREAREPEARKAGAQPAEEAREHRERFREVMARSRRVRAKDDNLFAQVGLFVRAEASPQDRVRRQAIAEPTC